MIVDSFFLSYNDETKYVKEIMLMANCFFIDFENVHNAGLSNLKGLTKDDLFYIFYTVNAESITLDNLNLLNKSCCKYDLIKVPAGSQSLDMHLISFVGYAIGIHGKKYNYVVISKDKDYDNIISFWEKKCGISIKRQTSINVISAKTIITSPNANSNNKGSIIKEHSTETSLQNNEPQNSICSQIVPNQTLDKNLESDIEHDIEKILISSGYSQNLVDGVKKEILDCSKEEITLNSFHNKLMKLTEDYHAIYELIKPLIKNHIKSVAKGEEVDSKKTHTKLTLNEKVQKVLREKSFSSEIFNSVASIVCKNQKEKNAKLLVYRNLVSKYGQDKGLKFYRYVKPLL